MKTDSKIIDDSMDGTPTKKIKLNNTNNVDSKIEGQFTCQFCHKAFTKKSSLARHKYEHSGEDEQNSNIEIDLTKKKFG